MINYASYNLINGLNVAASKDYCLGVEYREGAWCFGYATKSDSVRLLIYEDMQKKPVYSIPLDKNFKNGNVFSFKIKGKNLNGLFYCYQDGTSLVADTFAQRIERTELNGKTQIFGVISHSKFKWDGDVRPEVPYDELIIYKTHLKGFTKNKFSKVRHKGTFKGLSEKIPYLVELGINAIELMPIYEIVTDDSENNYWGYGRGFYFAPKKDYCSTTSGDYTDEIRQTVKLCHQAGIEVYLEMYFPYDVAVGEITDSVRYWKKEYHIDGVHLICEDNAARVLSEDVFLSDLKLFFYNWDEKNEKTNLCEYNDGFLESARRLLKGDEDQLSGFLHMMRKNPKHAATVNYVANNNGFTLADVYSYDRKHNENNGEGNRDGADYNISWNCGVEGPTKKKKILELRSNLIRAALTMIFTAQGVPLLYAGDEFGNSQSGNNNAYCQDNEIGWVDWNCLNRNRKLFEFVKYLISFRKQNKVIHMNKEPYMMDYKYVGLPDVSYHGSKAWYPGLEHYNRHVGIMLCGKYEGSEEDIYIAINMHWEPHELAIPNISKKSWRVLFTTGKSNEDAIIDDRMVTVAPRTIAVLTDKSK